MHTVEHIFMFIFLGFLKLIGVTVWFGLSFCCTDDYLSKVHPRLCKLAVATLKALIVFHYLALIYLFGLSKLTVKILQTVFLYDCRTVLILISISALIAYPISIWSAIQMRKSRSSQH